MNNRIVKPCSSNAGKMKVTVGEILNNSVTDNNSSKISWVTHTEVCMGFIDRHLGDEHTKVCQEKKAGDLTPYATKLVEVKFLNKLKLPPVSYFN